MLGKQRFHFTVYLFILSMIVGCGKELTDVEYVQQSKDARDRGELNEEVIHLKNALRQNPDNIEARFLLGNAYIEAGDGASAEKELVRASELGMESQALALLIAEAQLLQRKFREMLDQTLSLKLNRPADQALLLALRGRAFAGLNEAELARKSFNEALEMNPELPEALVGLAGLAMVEKDYEQAQSLLDRILEKDPDYINALILRGQIQFQLAEFEQAVASYHKILESNPEHIVTHLLLAKAEQALGNTDPALTSVNKVLQANPNFANANFLKGQILYQLKNYDGAQESLQRVLKYAPNHSQAHLLMGSVQYYKGNYNQAEQNLSLFVSTFPEHVPAAKLYATTLMKLGVSEQATEVLQRIARITPNDPMLLAQIGRALSDAGDFEQAQKYYQRARAIDPNIRGLRTELALQQLREGDTDDAIALLQDELRENQDFIQAELLLMTSYFRDEDLDQAIAYANGLVERKPESPVGYSFLGMAHLTSGNKDKAQQAFEQALGVDPDYGPSLYNLALFHNTEGNVEQAKDYYQRVLKLEGVKIREKAMLGMASLVLNSEGEEASIKWVEQAWNENVGALQPGLFLTRHYLRQRRNLRALGIAEELNARHASNPVTQKVLGLAHLAVGDFSSALRNFRRFQQAVPNAAEPYLLQADALVAAGDVSSALQALEKGLTVDEDHLMSLTMIVRLSLDNQGYHAALDAARRIQKFYPNISAGWHMEGDALSRQGNHTAAVEAYETAYTKSPSELVAVLLASSLEKAGKAQRGVTVLQEWLELYPESKAASLQLAEINASASVASGIDHYREILESQPDNVVALNNIALLYHQVGSAAGLDYAERAYKLAQDVPAVKDTLGWLLIHNNQLDRGLELLQEAAKASFGDSEILYHLAVAFQMKGMSKEAVSRLELALASEVEFSARKEAQQLLQTLQK